MTTAGDGASGDVRVSRVYSNDWPKLRAIRVEALRDTPEAFGSTLAEALTYSNDRWREMSATRCFFIAEIGDQVVGMSSGGLNDAHPGTRWLYGMYVTPTSRGTSVAVQLVDAVVTWAISEGVDELFLHVTNKVPRAQAFYAKIGFSPTGDRFTMPRDPDVELITMRRDLGD